MVGASGQTEALEKQELTAKAEESKKTVLASCLAFFDEKQPDLAAVVRAWDRLPAKFRQSILGAIRKQAGPSASNGQQAKTEDARERLRSKPKARNCAKSRKHSGRGQS